VELNTVKLDSLGSHVQGYLAKPSHPGKFPALVIYQYAGVYALNPATATARAAEGWLAFNVDSHDILPSDSTGPPSNYQAAGNTSRETSYFLNMYLRDARAIDYIASRPDWDGHTIVIMGTSMGGQQSLVTAGLRPDKITAVLVNEPSGADSNGDLHGRKAGYPNWASTDPKVMSTALYFDTVNFAPRIKAPVLCAIGFIDTISPPAGIWSALNQIPGPYEPIPMIDSDHNNRTPEKQGAWESRWRELLASLRQGGEFKPGAPVAVARLRASQAAPRTDENSMLAHRQLLAKTKQGVIDVYFEGDSITRRWGATDYPDFLANWNQNFHGWNAADFGWGADRIQNILWRLENGELDGVNPKVIVLMAGTNNVGNTAPANEAETAAQVADITEGLTTTVRLMQAKAPAATIILTAIFPRNDNMAVMPIIDRVNRNLAALADGKRVRFLNVNGALADPAGRLFDGMMNADKLHPALKGYQVWADGLKPILTELLGPPKAEDHAPPPTGDPKAAK
jgi:cephalosporin-C deacetylase-like acetyl esterase/lysophospholipase L1-like esterase